MAGPALPPFRPNLPAFDFAPPEHVVNFWEQSGRNKEDSLMELSFDWLRLRNKPPYKPEPYTQCSPTSCRIYAAMTVINLHKHVFGFKENQCPKLDTNRIITEFGNDDATATIPTGKKVLEYVEKEMKKMKGVTYRHWVHPEVKKAPQNPPYVITHDMIPRLMLEFGPISGSILVDDTWRMHEMTPCVTEVGRWFIEGRNRSATAPLHATVITGWETLVRGNTKELVIRVRDSRGPKWGYYGDAFAKEDRWVARLEMGLLVNENTSPST